MQLKSEPADPPFMPLAKMMFTLLCDEHCEIH